MEFLWRRLCLCLLLGLVSGQQSRSRAISSSASSDSSTLVDFDCPDEFGYYPHPSDCTQYYVCVFGGALLESCTGGLVYSHELQTCDWPRNVECIPGQAQISAKSRSQASTARPKVDLRTRKPGNVPPVSSNVPISNEERFTSSISHPFANSGNALPQREPQRSSSSRPLTFVEDDLQLQEEFDANRQGRLFRLQNSNNAQPDGRKVGGTFNNKQQTIAREPERPTFESSQFYDIDLDSSQHLGGFDPQFSDRSDFIPYGDFARRQGSARPRPVQEFEFVPSRRRTPPSIQFKRNTAGLPLDQLGPVPIRNAPPTDTQSFSSLSFGSFHQPSDQPSFQRPNVQDTPSPAFPAPHPFSAPVPLPVNANRSPVLNTHFDTRQFGPPNFPPRDLNLDAQGRPWPASAHVGPNEEFQPSRTRNQSPNLNPFTHFRQPTPPLQSIRDQEDFTHVTSTSSRPSAPQFFNQFPPSAQFPHGGSRDAIFRDQSKFETPQTTPPVRTTAPQVPSEPEVIAEDESGASNGDDFTTFATESPTTLTRQTSTEETQNLRDRPKQQTTFQEAAPHNGNQFLVQTQFAPDVNEDDFDSWGNQFQTTTRQQQLQLQQQKQQQQQQLHKQQQQQQSQPTHRPRPIPDHFFENTPQERPSSGVPARPVFQFQEVVTESPPAPVRISRPSTEAAVSLFDQNVEQFSRPQTPAPVNAPEEIFHSVEQTDVDYENFEDAVLPQDHNQNWQVPQSGEVLTEEVTETRTTTTTTTTTPAPTTRRTTPKPTTTTTTTTTPRPSRQPSRTEEKSRGSTRHQASKPVVSSDDDDVPAPPPKRGSSRPSLKADVIASKAEPFDVSKNPPSRPAARFAQPRVGDSAAKCNSEVCQLPDCYCGGKEVPGGLKAHQTPQIVLLTFDDAVNDLNKELYGDLFETGRLNPNGCPIAATFYVSHEWTDYGQVQSLYADGHEIASHTISHSFGEQFSAKKWAREAAGQRDILAAYGGVKPEDIRGLRAPFLSIGGNNMFKMLYDMNFTYDSSMPVYENKPPSWPYTLDYKIFHDCMIPPCPTKSYPGVWEVPMVMWQDLNGGRCSMGDGCSNPPDAEGVYKMLIKNFERHYTSNRAPFPLYYHAAWFTTPHHKEGFEAFLDTIVAMDDVWLVTNWQAIQWVREPTSLEKIKSFKPFGCDYPDRPKRCNSPKVCNSWHKSGVRYMRTCQACPDVFPWTGKTGVRDLALDNYEED